MVTEAVILPCITSCVQKKKKKEEEEEEEEGEEKDIQDKFNNIRMSKRLIHCLGEVSV